MGIKQPKPYTLNPFALMRKQIHIVYSGRVQGVGFRYTARETAQRLGLTGWARNCRDGSVEVVVEGSEESLLDFLTTMKAGPLGANIMDADMSWREATEEFDNFSVRPTA